MPTVALLIIVSFALIVPSIVAAGFLKIFVDDILIKHADSWLAPLLIGMAVTALFRAVLTILRQSLLLRLQSKLAVVMISRFLWHVMTLPVEFFTQRHSGDMASRVAANEQIARLLPVVVIDPVIPMRGSAFDLERRPETPARNQKLAIRNVDIETLHATFVRLDGHSRAHRPGDGDRLQR